MPATLLDALRAVLAFFESIILLFAGFFTSGRMILPCKYQNQLNQTGIFANKAQCSLPQTAMFGIVVDHFSAPRTGGKIPKALVVVYDGARADALLGTKDDPRSAVQALKADGGKIYNVYCGGDFPRYFSTSTSPGYATLLTGHWAKERGGTGHGITKNGLTKAPGAAPIIFNALFELEQPIGQSAFVGAWDDWFSYPSSIFYHDKAYAQEKGYNARWFNLAYDGDVVLYDAALALIGHERLASINIGSGMFSKKTVELYPLLADRIPVFEVAGLS